MKTKMYRFVEQETVDGRSYMLRGLTRASIRSIKHLSKVGTPTMVRGYQYRDRYGFLQMAVKVFGTAGTVRFSGFSWGYCGEGPRGLQKLFNALGVIKDASTFCVWNGWDAKYLGTHWQIKL